MANEKLHKCGHVMRKKTRRGKVYEEVCGRNGAEPMFTKALTGPHTRPQPRWFCNVHWPRHEEVMFDGVPVKKREFPGSTWHAILLKAVS